MALTTSEEDDHVIISRVDEDNGGDEPPAQTTKQAPQGLGKRIGGLFHKKDKGNDEKKKQEPVEKPKRRYQQIIQKWKHRKGTRNDRERQLPQTLVEFARDESPSPEAVKDATEVVLELYEDKPASAPLTGTDSVQPDSYPYAKKVPDTPPVAPSSLPQPTEVFNALLKSNGQRQAHANNMSSLMHAIGIIIALSVVRTSQENNKINKTSPYLDLAPLYGLTSMDSEDLRELDGRGFLSPDCYFEDNVMLTNSAAALLILLNRNHNYIATRLLERNEKGWKPIESIEDDDEQLRRQDDQIFTLARLINCIHFKNIICQDFLKGLIGIPHIGGGMNFDLLDKATENRPTKFYTTVESTLLYNLQSLLSDGDVRQLERKLENNYGKSPKEITVDDLQRAPRGQNNNKRKRDCAGLRRGPDFRFNDDEIANVLYTGTEQVAGAALPNNVAECLQVWQVQLIEQARYDWQVCTFNQYRTALGLKPLKNFREWNPRAADTAERLYKTIDNLELYPGLQGEEAPEGDGFALGYTWSHALSSDLISRVRNDPNFTDKATAEELTEWGYEECMAPTWNNGAFSAMLPRLLQRGLPRQYPYNNIYSLFPLLVPRKAKADIERVYKDKAHTLYTFEKPSAQPQPYQGGTLTSLKAIQTVFNRPEDFVSPYDEDLKALTKGYGYFLGFDHKELHNKDRLLMMYSLLPDSGASSRHVAYYCRSFDDILKERLSKMKISIPGTASVDIVEIINLTCTRWVRDNLFGQGSFTKNKDELEIFHNLESLYAFILIRGEPENRWKLRHEAMKTSEDLREHILHALPVPYDYDRLPPWWEELRQDVSSWFLRKLQELEISGGRKIEVEVQTFLSRIFRYSSNFSLGELINEIPHLKELRDRLYIERKNAHQFVTQWSEDRLRRHLDGDVDADFERERIVANILGLIIVASVKVAYACTAVTAFYLQDIPGIKAARDDIIQLASKADLNDDEKKKLRGYIWEAQRLAQPLVLQRVAKRDILEADIDGRGGRLVVPSGNVVTANLRHESKGDSLINPHRITPGLYGFGLHKCPAMGNEEKMNFADEVLCGIISSIFRLPDIQVTSNISASPSSPHKSLTISFKVDQRNQIWSNKSASARRSEWGQTHRNIHNRFQTVISYAPREFGTLFFILFMILWVTLWLFKGLLFFSLVTAPMSIISVFYTIPVTYVIITVLVRIATVVVMSPVSALFWVLAIFTASGPNAPRKEVVIQAQQVDCPQPITQLTPFEFVAFELNRDGTPTSVTYTSEYSTAHRVNVIDVDKRDTKMAVLIDGIGRGSTRDFELNKQVDCGENYYKCLTEGWSAGMVTIPPGKHTIEIRYDGKEYIGNTSRVDWGGETSRRFVWWKEQCSPA